MSAAAAAAVPRVLVTGASGFIGAHCVHHLLEAGWRVRGTVRRLSAADKVEPLRALPHAGDRLELVEADLLRAESWAPAVDGCTYVLHVASPFLIDNPKTQEEADRLLYRPALDGACAATGPARHQRPPSDGMPAPTTSPPPTPSRALLVACRARRDSQRTSCGA